MKKKILVLLSVLLFAAFLSGCGSKNDAEGLITIDIYSQAANYQGIQPGWFGKIIEDKFNIKINVITPQVAGDGKALFQTRAASGHLGDIIILDNSDFLDCVKVGLVQDISSIIGDYPNLQVFDYQIKAFNANVPRADGKIYGIPCQMTNTSPLAFSSLLIYSSPILPWDLYTEIGAPRLHNLNNLLDALEKMQKARPVNPDGDPAYAISLWPDWDVTSNEIINQTVKWYGVEVASGYPQSSVLLDTENNMKSLVDDNGEYRKMLKFFNDANMRGLVDPDSGTQQWEQIVTKIRNRRVYLLWYSWQPDFWNSTNKGNARQNWMPIPVDDMYFFQESDSYYGDGRVWGLGSKMSPERRKRVMEFLDWMASPEGLDILHNGIKDFCYEVMPDGSYRRTPTGEIAYAENLPVPDEYGGGGYYDGNQWINQWIAASASINPTNGFAYDYKIWPEEIKKARTTTMLEWEKIFGASSQVEYLKKNNQLGLVPRVNVVLPSDPTDIQLIRSECSMILRDGSWKMIFARNNAEFNRLWTDMKTQLNGFGWEKMYQYDVNKFQAVIKAREVALETYK